MSEVLGMEQWEVDHVSFEMSVTQTPHIASVCSGFAWQKAAYEELHASRPPVIVRSEDHWLLMSLGRLSPFSRVLQPFEMMWGFGCPLLGKDSDKSVQMLLETLHREKGRWQAALVAGVPSASPLWNRLHEEIPKHYSYDILEGSNCCQTSLAAGSEAWLDSRSRSFRANLRRASKLASEAEIRFEAWTSSPEPDALFSRMMAVEEASWKHQQRRGIFLNPNYKRFYAKLLTLLSQNQTLRLLFATQEGRDLAYVFGGVLGPEYRGFQLSYDETLAHLSLGNLMQWEMIQRLATEGIQIYDLGMFMEYKTRWADEILHLSNFVIFDS